MRFPLHTHHNEDEYSHVLEGRFGVQLGEVVARYRLDIDFTTVPTLAERHHLRLGWRGHRKPRLPGQIPPQRS